MKLENTLENKAKFFAQYWGQEVFRHSLKRHNGFVDLYSLNDRNVNQNYAFLELSPLSQITDEYAIEVDQILTRFKWNLDLGTKVVKEGNQVTVYYDGLKGGFHHKTTIYDDFFSRNYNGEPIKCMCGDSFDYLRSKGYALPFMGLSVEDLVEYGWVKLAE